MSDFPELGVMMDLPQFVAISVLIGLVVNRVSEVSAIKSQIAEGEREALALASRLPFD